MRCRAPIFGLALTLLSGGVGCAGSAASRSTQEPEVNTAVTRIDARSRADRRKIDALEHELTTLKRQLAEREATALPPLPIEVREPEEQDRGQEPLPASQGRHTAAQAGAEPALDPEMGEVVGVDDDGVEIVYVGDAARDESVRPRPPPSWTSPPAARTRSASPRSASPRSAPPRTAPSGTAPTIESQMAAARQEQLPITDRVGPKVDRWVQSGGSGARRPVVQDPPPRRVAARPAPRPKRPPSSLPPSSLPGSASGSAPGSSGDPKPEYKRALEALRAGDHAAAIDGFRALIVRYPAHDLTDNAQYWLGETLYDQRLFRDALLEFRKVVDNHPRGNKVPDALLKIGYCHAALGEPEEARAALELVMSMYPKSKPAALAAQRIESLAEE